MDSVQNSINYSAYLMSRLDTMIISFRRKPFPLPFTHPYSSTLIDISLFFSTGRKRMYLAVIGGLKINYYLAGIGGFRSW